MMVLFLNYLKMKRLITLVLLLTMFYNSKAETFIITTKIKDKTVKLQVIEDTERGYYTKYNNNEYEAYSLEELIKQIEDNE
jgi:hypothetical protein